MQGVHPQYIQAFDGTRLAVYSMGAKDAPTFFLINGLGGNLDTWKHIINYFKNRLRIISFDYRGIFNSGTPPYKDFSMEAHVRDALLTLEHFEVESAVVMGWSMGVQVALELFRKTPEQVRGLVLANGAFGRPLDVAMPRLKPLALLAMDLIALYAPVLRIYARPLLRSRLPIKLAKAVGLVSGNLDEKVFLALAQEYVNLDFVNYRENVRALVTHDGEAVLDTVDVPTLIIAGTKDFFTPRFFSEEMHRRIRGAELLVIRDASHYCAVEYPDLLNLRIEKFFRERMQLV